jgi:predicted phosphodiesterase
MPDATDAELEGAYAGLEHQIAAYGHIHLPFVRHVSKQCTVANSGSVGLPFDGDARASYLLIMILPPPPSSSFLKCCATC